MQKVIAVVLTYNRKKLLEECLNAILQQTYPVEKIVLVDNGSTDGTQSYLEDLKLLQNDIIDYSLIKKNVGPAAGYEFGMSRALSYDADWQWVMDDDTIPTSTCLEELIKASETLKDEKISFLASTVFGENNEFMNVPPVDTTPSENGYQSWYKYLKEGLVRISAATYVSLLIKQEAMKICGFPYKGFYFWGIDTEQTRRFIKFYGDAYFCGKSIAIHKRKNAKDLNIETETSKERIKDYSSLYMANAVITNYYDGKKAYFFVLLRFLKQGTKLLLKGRLQKAFVLYHGCLCSLMEKHRFKKFMQEKEFLK